MGDAPKGIIRPRAALMEGEDDADAEAVPAGHGGKVEVPGPIVNPGRLALDDAPPELHSDARDPGAGERSERGRHGAAPRHAAPGADGVGGERDVDGCPRECSWRGRRRDVEDLAPATAAGPRGRGQGPRSGRGGWAAGAEAGRGGGGGGEADERRAAVGGGSGRRRRGDRRHC
jgi:hypothetical protein